MPIIINNVGASEDFKGWDFEPVVQIYCTICYLLYNLFLNVNFFIIAWDVDP